MANLIDSIFSWLSKLAEYVISPDSLLVILILLAWVLLIRGSYRRAKWLLGFLTISVIVIMLFPVGELLLFPLQNRFPTNPEMTEQVDGIMVLGGSENIIFSVEWNQVETGEGAERYLAFLALARRYPNARLVFTGGGSGSILQQDYKEAEVAKRLFGEQKLDLSRVTLESNSRNTYENAVFSIRQIKPVPGETWILITSAFHMPRSIGVFCKAGWPMIPYPVDHRSRRGNLLRIDIGFSRNLANLIIGMREWAGLFVYYITGKTKVLFPNQCV